MKRIFQSRFFAYQSDNLKSKIEKRPRGLKWLWLSVIAFVLVVVEVVAQAQQPARIPRIGYVTSTGNSNNPGLSGNAFRQGLRDLGYVEGKNILVEYRYIEGDPDRIPGLLAELLQLKVDRSCRHLSIGDPYCQAGDQDYSHCHGDNSGSSRSW